MSVFKQFLSQDVIVTPFQVNKTFQFTGGDILTGSNINIDRFIGTNVTGTFFPNSDPTTGFIASGSYQRCIYNSIKTLYYSNFISSSKGDEAYKTIIENGVILSASLNQPRFENYLQTTLTQNRYFPTSSDAILGVISIPNRLFGEQIKPRTFVINSPLGSLLDDGEGNLYVSTDPYVDADYINDQYFLTLTSQSIVGNIVYSHGLAVITRDSISGSSGFIGGFTTGSNVTMSFQSTYTIHESQYKCTIRESEFNFSLNPTLLSGSSNDTVYNFVTGSFFSPYITMVGLYDDQQNLLAVAKLAQPLPSSRTTDMNIIINLDR